MVDSPANAIADLDTALLDRGADVVVYRGTTVIATAKAFVRGIRAEEMRAGSSSSQIVSRIVMSPTAFAAGALPLKTTDKILWNGAQRVVLSSMPIVYGGTTIRIEADIAG